MLVDRYTARTHRERHAIPSGLSAWLDADPIKLTPETTLDVTPGRHRVTIAIELSERKEPLRVELADVPGLAAKVQLVSGK